MHKTVATGSSAALDIFQLKRDDPVSKKGHDRVNGSGKGEPQIGPPHGFGKWNRHDDFRDDSLKEPPGCLAPLNFTDTHVIAFGCGFRGQAAHRNTLAPCKAFTCLRGLPLGVKRHCLGRPHNLPGDRGLTFSHTPNHKGQTPWSCKCLSACRRFYAGLSQLLHH